MHNLIKISTICRSRSCFKIPSNSSQFRPISTTLNELTPEDLNPEIPQFPPQPEAVEDGPRKSKHPYRNLYPWQSKSEFAQHLIDNVAYDKHGLLAICKPYGVGVRNFTGPEKSSHHQVMNTEDFNLIGEAPYTIEDVIPFLKRETGNNDLRIVKSFEKSTSGMTIFAQDEKAEKRFKDSVVRAKPLKIFKSTYHAIVNVLQGQLTPNTLLRDEKFGITLMQNNEKSSKQPKILREYSERSIKLQTVLVVRSSVKVISNNPDNKTALLEIQISQTKWNALRLYLTELFLPILGDHLFANRIGTFLGKYSKLGPFQAHPTFQKLSPNILNCLGLREERDSCIIPPHLHLHSLTLPNYLKGEEGHLTITCPPPEYFSWTLKQLQLDSSIFL